MYLSMLCFQGNVFNAQNWLKGYELYTIPVDNLTRTWMKRFFPYDVFGRLASLNYFKMAEKERKIQPTAVPLDTRLCRSVVPWRCTTRFRPAVHLYQLEMIPCSFPIPCPRQDSEGEKSRPLDHMRQIPFVGTSVPPYWLKLRFSHVYIWQCSHFVFHVVRFEVWACARDKTI